MSRTLPGYQKPINPGADGASTLTIFIYTVGSVLLVVGLILLGLNAYTVWKINHLEQCGCTESLSKASSVGGVTHDTSSPMPGGNGNTVHCNPATCETHGTIEVDGAFLSTTGVTVTNSRGECCDWDPRQSGPGDAKAPATVTLAMQARDTLNVAARGRLVDATHAATVEIPVTLSGGDLAMRVCLGEFTFTADKHITELNRHHHTSGGFLCNNRASFLPAGYTPATVNGTVLPLDFTPAAAHKKHQIFARFNADGSVCLTGPHASGLPVGKYTVRAACVIYNARVAPQAAVLPELDSVVEKERDVVTTAKAIH